MSEVFNEQSLLSLTAPTGYSDLASAEVTEILYWKPSGEHGWWPASVNGSSLVYSFADGDIDEVGRWFFQSYIEVGGSKGYGAIKTKLFQKHL